MFQSYTFFFFLRSSWPLVSSRTRLGRPLLSSWSRWYRTPLLPYPKRNFLLSLKTSSPNGNNEFVLRWYGTSWVINIDKSTLYHIQNIIINLKFSNRIVFDYKIHLNYYDYWVFLVKEKNKVTVQFISFFVKKKVYHNILVSHYSFIQCLSQRIFRCGSKQSKIFSSIMEDYMYLNNLVHVPVENQFHSNEKL